MPKILSRLSKRGSLECHNSLAAEGNVHEQTQHMFTKSLTSKLSNTIAMRSFILQKALMMLKDVREGGRGPV
jgi:hypothetical protein